MPVPFPDPDTLHLWLARIDGAPTSADRRLLDPGEQARADSFRFVHHRDAFVAAHAALRRVLGACLRIAPDRVALAAVPNGKPCLAVETPLRFNLSHSGGWALIGLAHEVEIGVDIERIRPIPERAAIAAGNFAAAEHRLLEALPAAHREDGFFACWTRKEAYVKAIGLGLHAALDGFVVSVDPARPAVLLSIGGDADAAAGWTLWGERGPPQHWLAAAAARPGMQVRLAELVG